MNASNDKENVILLHDVYADELRFHAVGFLWLGHGQLKAADFANAEEDYITQELVRAMRAIQISPDSPEWVDRYQIHEQPPQNVDGKSGKRRPKMDIEFECHRRGVRPRLGFEAKRLGNGKTIRDYLGPEGLAAFVSGYYPTTHGEAGMIDYIQEASVDSWATKLASELAGNGAYHSMVMPWEQNECRDGRPFYSSTHKMPIRSMLLVTHVLLPFLSDK